VAIGSLTSVVYSKNIDPYDVNAQYAYCENIGWINFEPNVADPNAGAQVSSSKITGFIWAENIGWLSLSCENTGSCGTVDYGVVNDGVGNLSGYAWGENIGWINFDPQVSGDPNNYGVKIDSDGNFSGWAWGENIGWINFNSADLFGCNVKACKVNFDDLANFVAQWLETGCGPDNNWCQGADLTDPNKVDFIDYSVFGVFWRDYCPDGWLLK